MAIDTQASYDRNPTQEILRKGEQQNLVADVLFTIGGVVSVAATLSFLLLESGEGPESTGQITEGTEANRRR